MLHRVGFTLKTAGGRQLEHSRDGIGPTLSRVWLVWEQLEHSRDRIEPTLSRVWLVWDGEKHPRETWKRLLGIQKSGW